jgi:hypothetical protein
MVNVDPSIAAGLLLKADAYRLSRMFAFYSPFPQDYTKTG